MTRELQAGCGPKRSWFDHASRPKIREVLGDSVRSALHQNRCSPRLPVSSRRGRDRRSMANARAVAGGVSQ
jgi:hypothetical protein